MLMLTDGALPLIRSDVDVFWNPIHVVLRNVDVSKWNVRVAKTFLHVAKTDVDVAKTDVDVDRSSMNTGKMTFMLKFADSAYYSLLSLR